jgi:hypothetical protein
MNILKSLVVGIGVSVAVLTADAASYSVTVLPGTMTNLFAFGPNQGSVLAKQFTLTTVGATASSAYIIDAPTNALSFTTVAYSNIVSYATNYVLVWTNYYGVLQSNNYVGGQLLTNWQLVDITNSVPSATYAYPIRLGVAAAGNTTATYGPINTSVGSLNGYYFDYGIWVTNTSTGTNLITVVY